MVSAGHEYVHGTHGAGIVSSAADVRGMTGIGGVCEMCMCLEVKGLSEYEDCVWTFLILWKQREC